MKKKLHFFIFAFLLTACSLHGREESEEINPDKLSETLGHLLVRHLAQPGFEFNLDKVIQGIQEERAGKPSPMNEEEYEQALYSIQERVFLRTAENNLSLANSFLEKNAQGEGIQLMDDKVQFKVDQVGLGKEVSADSVPLIHYKGSLLDGTVFATSNEPLALPIKQTIPGFAKGLVGMKEGEKRTIYIHPELAYGVSGHLPPNSLLIFEVEVIKADSPEEDLSMGEIDLDIEKS